MINLSSSDEGLAGNAPIVEAVTPEEALLLNEKSLGAKLGGSGSDGETSGSSTYDAHIKIIIRHDILLFTYILIPPPITPPTRGGEFEGFFGNLSTI
jgi:hypothetical protein